MAAYYKMETIEHFAKISLVARLLGREHLISREEVERLQGLRGTTASPRLLRQYGSQHPAGCRPDPQSGARGARIGDRAAGSGRQRNASASEQRGEIRLIYGELTAPIADAIKQLRD